MLAEIHECFHEDGVVKIVADLVGKIRMCCYEKYDLCTDHISIDNSDKTIDEIYQDGGCILTTYAFDTHDKIRVNANTKKLIKEYKQYNLFGLLDDIQIAVNCSKIDEYELCKSILRKNIFNKILFQKFITSYIAEHCGEELITIIFQNNLAGNVLICPQCTYRNDNMINLSCVICDRLCVFDDIEHCDVKHLDKLFTYLFDLIENKKDIDWFGIINRICWSPYELIRLCEYLSNKEIINLKEPDNLCELFHVCFDRYRAYEQRLVFHCLQDKCKINKSFDEMMKLIFGIKDLEEMKWLYDFTIRLYYHPNNDEYVLHHNALEILFKSQTYEHIKKIFYCLGYDIIFRVNEELEEDDVIGKRATLYEIALTPSHSHDIICKTLCFLQDEEIFISYEMLYFIAFLNKSLSHCKKIYNILMEHGIEIDNYEMYSAALNSDTFENRVKKYYFLKYNNIHIEDNDIDIILSNAMSNFDMTPFEIKHRWNKYHYTKKYIDKIFQ